MVQKIALLAGGFGAAAVLALALGLVNFAFVWPSTANTADTANTATVASVSDNQPAAQAGDGAGTSQSSQSVKPQTKTVYDKVYVAPTPPPKVIHVAGNTPNGTSAQPTKPAANPTTASPKTSNYEGGDGHDSQHASGRHGGDD